MGLFGFGEKYNAEKKKEQVEEGLENPVLNAEGLEKPQQRERPAVNPEAGSGIPTVGAEGISDPTTVTQGDHWAHDLTRRERSAEKQNPNDHKMDAIEFDGGAGVTNESIVSGRVPQPEAADSKLDMMEVDGSELLANKVATNEEGEEDESLEKVA